MQEKNLDNWSAFLDELTHARYGGSPPIDAAARAAALVAALDPALRKSPKPN